MSACDSPEDDDVVSDAPHATEPVRPAVNVKTIPARELLGETGMLRIELDGELYTLRVTRNNRLILTK